MIGTGTLKSSWNHVSCADCEMFVGLTFCMLSRFRLLLNSYSGTEWRPAVLAQGHALRGRMLAALGQLAEAEAAFEAAVAVAHETGLRLFEMLALRDLHVLLSVPSVFQKTIDAAKSADVLKRLRWALRAMRGPPAELSRLLGSGLDADEILRGI